VRKFVIFLVVLIALVVGADIAGRLVAESKTGEAIATQGRITPAPEVNIHGFSFLWQAVGGTYSHVTVSSSNLSAGRLARITAVADLYGVKLPFSDAISGKVDNLTAGRADLVVAIPAAALSSALGQQNLTVGAGDSGALRITTTVASGGRTFPVQIDVKPIVSDGVLHLSAARLIPGPVVVPPAVASQLAKDLTVNLPLTALPFPLRSASAAVEGSELVVKGTAEDVNIGAIIKAAG